MFDNKYGRDISNRMKKLDRQYIQHSDKLEGGFLGALASAILPSLAGAIIPKLFGNGISGGCLYDCECECEGKQMKGCGIQPKYRGGAKGVKLYQKQSEDKFDCGSGVSGGSGFNAGYLRDQGFEKVAGGKKRGRKQKMSGEGLEEVFDRFDRVKGKMSGEGFISDLGIPLVSNVAGLFGLGKGQPLPLGAVKSLKSKPPKVTGVVERSQMLGTEGGAKKRGRKPKMSGEGFISDLGIPLVSNVASIFGLGKKAKKGGAKMDSRAKRGQLIKQLMKEKGMKLGEASKYIKEHKLI